LTSMVEPQTVECLQRALFNDAVLNAKIDEYWWVTIPGMELQGS